MHLTPKLIWMPLGLIICIYGVQLAVGLLSHYSSASWTRVPAVVLKVEDHPKYATLRYRYQVRGKNLEGSKFQFMSPGTATEKEQILSGYKAGDKIMIFVNLSKPEQSVARRDPIQFQDLSNYLLIFFACVVVGVFSTSKLSREVTETDAPK